MEPMRELLCYRETDVNVRVSLTLHLEDFPAS